MPHLATVEYWRYQLGELSRRAGLPDDWQEWTPSNFANGTPIPPDLRPSLDLRSSTLNRAVQMFLCPLDDIDAAVPPDSIGAWISVVGSHFQLPGTLPYTAMLALNLVPNPATAAVAQRLLAAWVNPATTVPAMERLILGEPGANRT